MVEQLSPLEPVWKPGAHGKVLGGSGVVLEETKPGSIVQVAAFPGEEKALIAIIAEVAGRGLPDGAGGGFIGNGKCAFGFAPGKFMVVDQDEGLGARLKPAVPVQVGTVTDLSHGRTAIRISGPKSEWVLAKFFALDFSLPAFPEGAGRSTAHHDIFAQIQRVGPDAFDVYVFRSFARSFWTALSHASEEVGYEVR
jgi:heterotetrameric sarcosine oxidase gamma subunit